MDPAAVATEAARALLGSVAPSATAEEFLGAQFDAGLTWVHLPAGMGGLGLPPRCQSVVDEVLSDAGAPSGSARNPIGYGMAAPTIAFHGTEHQRSRYLRPLATGEEFWCQLFSEPEAGSDVANLATRAVRDGDEWVVTGQKVWSSGAQLASHALLAARTDPDVPKHKGLTYFVLDMSTPGVEVRPLRQLTGDAEFNEVYLTEVRIPDSDRLGDPGQGWHVMLTTLMNERTAFGRPPARGTGPIAGALDLWRSLPASHTPLRRDRLVQLWIDAEVGRLTSIRARERQLQGVPGPEGSVGKLAATELHRRLHELCVDLLGPGALLYDGYDRQLELGAEPEPARAFLRSRANTIEGGTSEIMRNILGERVLGLPPEPRVDRDASWSELTRGRSGS